MDSLLQNSWQSSKTANEVRMQQSMQSLQQRLQSGQGDEQKLKKTCQDFEAMFMNKLWQQMRSTVPKEGYLHSKEEDQYLGMFDQELSSKLAESGGIGLGKMLYENLKTRLGSASREAVSSDAANATQASQTSFKPQPLNPVQIPLAMQQAKVQAEATSQDTNETDNTAAAADTHDWRAMMQVEELAQLIIQRHNPNQGGREPAQAVELTEKTEEVQRESELPMLHWPLEEGEKSSSFGWRSDPFTGQRAWHAGVDLAAPVGSSVESCWPGTVSFVGEQPGYGRLVIVDHGGGWQSFYAHNNANLVQEGDSIEAGQKIAEVGSSGRSTGPHLHFELRQGNQAWDPEMILNRMQAGLVIGHSA